MNLEDMKNRFSVRDEDKLTATRYYESVADRYDEVVSAGFLSHLRARERRDMMEALKLDDPRIKSLMDVGCGAGLYALEAKRRGMEVDVIDASQGMIRRLQGKVDRAEVADIESYRSNRRYDRVICAGVLDFVVDPDKAFDNLARMVDEGGSLIILAPMQGAWSFVYWMEKFFSGLKVNFFTVDWFREAGKRHGLTLTFQRNPLLFNVVLRLERARQRQATVA